ncbi:hypothetical protein MKZ38_009113 [Zalerion maritima]|uniref:Uncharacterized protein n=1 Tax=Zalerion maritima TaxID=339359 RepID=A0AAD5WVA5_9PEZI|nr:hypothetical protein MKZ38_009113 [Zalerion maritima]
MARTKNTGGRSRRNAPRTKAAAKHDEQAETTENETNRADQQAPTPPPTAPDRPAGRQRGRPRKGVSKPDAEVSVIDTGEDFLNGAAVGAVLTEVLSPAKQTPEADALIPHSASTIILGSGVKIREKAAAETEDDSANEHEEEEGKEQVEEGHDAAIARQPSPDLCDTSSVAPPDGRPDPYDVPGAVLAKRKMANRGKLPYGATRYRAPGDDDMDVGMRASVKINTGAARNASMTKVQKPTSPTHAASIACTAMNSDADVPRPSIEGSESPTSKATFLNGEGGHAGEQRQDLRPNAPDTGLDFDDPAIIIFSSMGKEKVAFNTSLMKKILVSMANKAWSGIQGRGLGGWGGDKVKTLLSLVSSAWEQFCCRTDKESVAGQEYAKGSKARYRSLVKLKKLTATIPSKACEGVDSYQNFMKEKGRLLDSCISSFESSMRDLENMTRKRLPGYQAWSETELCHYIVPFLVAALHYTYQSGDVDGDHEFDLYGAQVMQHILGWLLRISAILELVLPKKIAMLHRKDTPKMMGVSAKLEDTLKRVKTLKQHVSTIRAELGEQVDASTEDPDQKRKLEARQMKMEELARQKKMVEAERIRKIERRFADSIKQKIRPASAQRAESVEHADDCYIDWSQKIGSNWRRVKSVGDATSIFGGTNVALKRLHDDFEELDSLLQPAGSGGNCNEAAKRRRTSRSPHWSEPRLNDWSDNFDNFLPSLPNDGAGGVPPRYDSPDLERRYSDSEHDGYLAEIMTCDGRLGDAGDEGGVIDDLAERDLPEDDLEELAKYVRGRKYGTHDPDDIQKFTVKMQRSESKIRMEMELLVDGMQAYCNEMQWRYPAWAKRD